MVLPSVKLIAFLFLQQKYNIRTSCNSNPKDKSKKRNGFGQFVPVYSHRFQLHSPLQYAHVQINLSLAGRWATKTVQNPNKQIKMWNICQVWADGVRSQNCLLINRNWFCCTPLFSAGSLDLNSPAVCAARSQISQKKQTKKKNN